MKLTLKLITLVLCLMAGSALAQEPSMPHMADLGHGQQLIVDGKPFVMLSGEIHNSSTGSAHYMRDIWQRMADKNMNSIIAAASWELVEPEEGKYDFSLVDSMIIGCRKAGLRLAILWFGSWKNGRSTYVPGWVKNDTKRFPLAMNADGEKTNIVSALGENTMKADAKAFAAMMRHIREIDSKDRTVILIQVENEIGMLGNSFGGGSTVAFRRDFSPLAEKAWKKGVPAELTQYLKAHENELQPAVADAWKANGKKMSGSWEEVFGKSEPAPGEDWQNEYPYLAEEIFNVWNYAKYVGYIAAEGKKEYPLPMYVNSWLKQNGNGPGNYPSGGPQPHIYDIWRAGAPAIDFFAPDIYVVQYFDWVCSTFSSQGNPLFIPETQSTPAGAARAFYTFGKYNAQCYAPFGIDGGGSMLSADRNDTSYDMTYAMMGNLMPYYLKYGGTDDIAGLFVEGERRTDEVKMGRFTITARPFSTARFGAVAGVNVAEVRENTAVPAGFIVFRLAEDEFLIAGGVGPCSISITGTPKKDGNVIGLERIDEISFDGNGNMLKHRLNGDEASMGFRVREGEVKAFLIKLYEY